MRAKTVNESVNGGIIAYHTSPEKLNYLGSNPMWFSTSEDLARVYHKNALEEGDSFTYKVLIEGKILSLEEAEEISDKMGIDFYELTNDLVSNPSSSEVKEMIQDFEKICDGFYLSDYDPRDPMNDVESILIFNPQENVKIIEQIS